MPDKAIKLMEEVGEAVREERGEHAMVSFEDVAAAVSRRTSIPLTALTEDERAMLLNLEDRLHERIIDQQEAVTPANLNDIFAIGDLIMTPFPAGPLQQRVSSVTRGADGVARIDWVYGDDLEDPGHDEGDTVTLPADLIANGESIIMSEVTYDYDSPVDHLLPATTKFSQTNYLRPRTVEMTACDAC